MKSLPLPPQGQVYFILTVQIQFKLHIHFIHLFAHLFSKYVLIIYCVLSNGLNTWNIAVID